MRILFLSRWYPYPPTNGSKVRIYNLLAHLGLSHQVDLAGILHRADETIGAEQLDAMRAHCRTVRAIPYRQLNWKSAGAGRHVRFPAALVGRQPQ